MKNDDMRGMTLVILITIPHWWTVDAMYSLGSVRRVKGAYNHLKQNYHTYVRIILGPSRTDGSPNIMDYRI